MADVARAAGVSPKTVSRVLNGSSQVRPEVRERVHAAVARLGYRRNGAARALAAGRTDVIGIVAPETDLHGVAQHVLDVERAARERGLGTVVVTTGDGEGDDAVRRAVDRAVSLGAEGVVVAEPLLRDPAVLDAFADVPLVVPGELASPHPLHRSVAAAEEEGARLATEHLLGLGHGTVDHVAGPASWRPAVLRERGWRAALRAAGALAPEPVRGDWSARSGYDATRELLVRGPFTALFAANDSMAIGAGRALQEAGLRVPGDVSVVGFDDLPEAGFLWAPLSSVRQDIAGVARRAVELLAGAMAGEPAPVGAPPVRAELVVRASSGPPPRGGGAGR
ncbi:substrate-binding domain-containing protein [Kineococcus sp. TRM81007]|uniref:LacI family DNA-binding transcriptional regulator n=1 Tax=Kineococcus sp. TRM81007 TaxID=2925831 RepID=UPI0021057FEE|nr:substrate-binding domain-containing protein [Kineococcus sp. TRM81007]